MVAETSRRMNRPVPLPRTVAKPQNSPKLTSQESSEFFANESSSNAETRNPPKPHTLQPVSDERERHLTPPHDSERRRKKAVSPVVGRKFTSLQHCQSPSLPPRCKRNYSEGSCQVAEQRSVSPAEKAIVELETGIVVTLLSSKKRPEILTICLKPSCAELVFVRSVNSKSFMTVNLHDIKEIVCDSAPRLGRTSEELCGLDADSEVITVLYGSNFLLNFLSFVPQQNTSEGDLHFDIIALGLKSAVAQYKEANYYQRKKRWFTQQFMRLENMQIGVQLFSKGKRNQEKLQALQAVTAMKISLKHVQAWLMQNGCQTSSNFLKLLQKKLKLPDYLGVEDFILFAEEILMKASRIDPLMKKYGTPQPEGNRIMTENSFKDFLCIEQKEKVVNDCCDRMLSCKRHSNDSFEVTLTQQQFEDYLFSPYNSIFNPEEKKVNQNMDLPLCCYWISSSHNTYLTGDQWKSESSVETYARCLRMGCRCLELDCWDGTDGKPIITHGRSLTSKIKLSDVLHTIKEHAWAVTDYPLILSLENHCSLPQQRLMALLFKEIFKDELLTEPVDVNEKELPSPNQLRSKIILKNKKLRDGKPEENRRSVEYSDETDTKKDGSLLIKYATSKNWTECDMILTDTSLCFSTLETLKEEEIESDSLEDYFAGYESDEEMPEDALVLNSQFWYHGVMERKAAEVAIREKMNHGDGTFLVRESERGGLVLSFLCQGSITHSKIYCKSVGEGIDSYLIGNEVWHSSILNLINYYKKHKLTYREKSISMSLTFGVDRDFDFLKEKWFCPDMDRVTAENFLKKIAIEGVFLVRRSSMENCFSLTFRHLNKISHFQIEYRRQKFTLGKFSFSSMNALIEFFQKHALLGRTKLSKPAADDLIDGEGDDSELYCGTYYTDMNLDQRVTVRALYDFYSYTPDQLFFKRGAIITNVTVKDQPWWSGDHGNACQKLFPATYVQVISNDTESSDEIPGEAILPLSGCSIQSSVQVNEGIFHFFVTHQSQGITLQIGSRCAVEVTEWLTLIMQTFEKLTVEDVTKKKQEISKNIAKELSDLIIYCQAVPFNTSRRSKYSEISSFSEERIGKDDLIMITYNQSRLSRVYPKFLRWTSTNFDPVPKWNVGCQMVALNYQTPDRSMQVNQARFRQNGRCGYILKPEFMSSPDYNPSDLKNLKGSIESVVLTVSVLCARNLSSGSSASGVVHPFIAVEVIGLSPDNQKSRTRNLTGEGNLNPVWKNETFVFHISCPDLAFIRFEVCSDGSETYCLGQATLPLKCILQGYRNVPLQNIYSEVLPMSHLLVHIDIKNPKEEEENNLSCIIAETQRLYNELSTSDKDEDESKRAKLQETKQKLIGYLKQSKQNGYGYGPMCFR